MARKKGKGTELSVFKGREAKLNRAIFQTLTLKGPRTIYDMYKQIRRTKGFKRAHYGNLNKRVRALEKMGYVKAVDIRNTKAGFEAVVYEPTARAYLAVMLSRISLDDLLHLINDDIASEILAALARLF